MTIVGQVIFATPDTGSEENIISLDIVQQFAVPFDPVPPDHTVFRLANDNPIKAIGQTRHLHCRFMKELAVKQFCMFYVLETCVAPMVMGMKFLDETETLSRHGHRLHFQEVPRGIAPRICSLNHPQRRLFCFANGEPALANADTGSDMNLISLAYARKQGFKIRDIESDYEREVVFSDGSRAPLYGKVTLWMRFADGEGPLESKPFCILEKLTSYILLGFELLDEIEAFTSRRHSFSVEESISTFSDLNTIVWFNPFERLLLKVRRHKEDHGKATWRSPNEALCSW